ncbi:MAG: TetR/AcrR family transcriptional regulator [Melioribacteraceae bacterium]|jgi:AcrR family transcriptional regulator|nr:TetR/AcrR family transcriptional regulator [Melioribacteraceae bacterium]
MARLTTEERQRTIIDEAINIIHLEGYDSFSIRELASKVKISEPAIYRHFLNKEDIVLGILSRIGEFDKKLEDDLNRGKTATEKLHRFIKFHFTFLNKNKEMTSVLFSEEIFNKSELLKEKLIRIIKYRKKLLTAIIQEGIDSKEIKDIEVGSIVTMVLGFIRLIVLEWRLGGFIFDLSKKSSDVVSAINKMILNVVRNSNSN